MFCPVTRKRSFSDEALALNALLQNQSNNFHKEEAGPINIYECMHCHDWHFTSKGERHPDLDQSELSEMMSKERLANHWERKLR